MKSLASRTQPGFRQAPPKWSEQWEAGSSPLKSCWDVFSALSSQRVGTGPLGRLHLLRLGSRPGRHALSKRPFFL